jgi:serine/threonine-protein kinase
MVARVSLCDRRQLELALSDLLLPSQSDELSQHLQSCPHCRTELEQLAGGGQWWSEAKTFLSSSDELVAVEDSGAGILPARMAKHAADPASGDCPLAEREDHISLHFLAPSDTPGMLGRLGNYEIEEVVGRGGMGVVLKAQDPALNRRVAIKVLAGHLATSAAARKRFAHEAQAAAAVVHDHVIPIHAVDIVGETPFLVMPFVTGRSLQDRLDERGSLETREVLRIAMQTAEGLAAAHAQGLVHRDIKPANILLENGCERVRITDFGLARAVDDASQTQSGFIAGTPQYMAPEQARGEPIDARADLFSLGSVMYAMCSGRPPFRAETTLAVLRRICDDEARDLREINPDVPPWLAAIVARLLAKSPADRLQSAAEVADLLKQWLAHLAQPLSIEAPKFVRPRAPERKRPKRREPWVIGLAVASTLLAGGALGVGIQSWMLSGAAANSVRRAEPGITATATAEPAAAAPTDVPSGRRDLIAELRAAEATFRSELAQANDQTIALEATVYDTSAGTSLSQELAQLEELVAALEQDLAPRTPHVQPVPVLTPAPLPATPDQSQIRPADR